MTFVVITTAQTLLTGVRLGGDSGMYLDGARALAAGQPLSVRQPSYAAYIAFIAAIQAAGAGPTGVLVAQLAAACGAAIVVGKIAFDIAGRSAALLAILIFAIDFETNRWHAFILSDSLFLSLLVTSVWLVYRALPLRAGAVALAVATLIAAAMVRPEGWFLVPAAIVFWIVAGVSRPAARAAAAATLVAAVAVVALLMAPRLSGNLTAVGPADMLRLGQTIWDFDGWRIEMPPDAVFDDGHASSADAIVYASRHPFRTLMLMAARVGVHFAHVRPFFSTAHNAVVLMWLVPLYALAAWGFWAWRDHRLCRWCLAALATQTLVVALTHADWDGRYLAHVTPLLYPFAAAALASAMTLVQSGRRDEVAVA
jgi:hypothetical protein